ncbi:superoxide dismutase [Scytonema sp. UIC 10036]|uniref:superoxide dismutase n=1 Tax=Scytonema sp. UIC 10036 TaxID=2304196 RepID=UPI0012DA4BA9|nr:superoxide dismutase [Scytonema sp. UIC 10036]MUG93969.1 superoxide dismutase [Scytonema sp. UIC 10036]
MSVNRRHFLFLLGSGAGVLALDAGTFAQNTPRGNQPSSNVPGAIQLPPLPYAYNALEPHIDAKTMQFHHDKHHATYVKNLNAAFSKHPELKGKSVAALLSNLNNVPEDIRTTVRNNGGGHVNHAMFWRIMKPKGGGEPTGAIASAITENFGSFASFKKQFNEAGGARFGSGWVWLVRTKNGNLAVMTTPNQDSPIVEGNYPIMGNDIWEHAYYLKYQNRRADYLNAWWNVLNWDEINKRFAASSKRQ